MSRFWVVSALFLLGACSNGEGNLTTGQPAKEPLLNSQMQSLEKAKGVEKLLQDGANRQKLVIDKESR